MLSSHNSDPSKVGVRPTIAVFTLTSNSVLRRFGYRHNHVLVDFRLLLRESGRRRGRGLCIISVTIARGAENLRGRHLDFCKLLAWSYTRSRLWRTVSTSNARWSMHALVRFASRVVSGICFWGFLVGNVGRIVLSFRMLLPMGDARICSCQRRSSLPILFAQCEPDHAVLHCRIVIVF